MSLDAASSNVLIDILGRALSPITKKLDVVRTRPTPTYWHSAVAESKSFTTITTRPGKATWAWENPLATDVRVRSVGIVFDDEPNDNYKPIVEISIHDGIVFKSSGDPFANANLTLDLDGGRPLPRNRSVEVRIWNEGSDRTAKTASFFLSAGEM